MCHLSAVQQVLVQHTTKMRTLLGLLGKHFRDRLEMLTAVIVPKTCSSMMLRINDSLHVTNRVELAVEYLPATQILFETGNGVLERIQTSQIASHVAQRQDGQARVLLKVFVVCFTVPTEPRVSHVPVSVLDRSSFRGCEVYRSLMLLRVVAIGGRAADSSWDAGRGGQRYARYGASGTAVLGIQLLMSLLLFIFTEGIYLRRERLIPRKLTLCRIHPIKVALTIVQ